MSSKDIIRKPIPKQVREQVYAKYHGHCAYCGCELEYKDMQVDHINSVYVSMLVHGGVDECLENYMPSCRMCNFYKSTFTLEAFRERLTQVMMKNLQKNFSYRLAKKYGLIEENVQPIVFYFEKVENVRKELEDML